MNNIATGILSSSPLSLSSSSTLFNLNRYRQFLITSLSSSSYEPQIKPNWKSRFYRKVTMSSSASPAANSGVSPSVAGDPVTEINKKPPPPPTKQYPWLIVGLGNPGQLYNRTRHNVGFEMVDAIAEAEGSIGNIPLMLAKPQTFMNVSVGAIVSFYKIPPKQVLVIYDDLDLPFGKLWLLPKGGQGGHNGMKSVINHLKGSRDFPCLRIGIGRPPGKMEAASYVLRRFTKQESDELEFTFQTGIEAVRILLLQGFDKSATFVNSLKPMKV